MGIWITCAPLHCVSIGKSVYVPVDLARRTLHFCSHPSSTFCQAFMWLHPPPIGSYLSPYSLCMQLPCGVSTNDCVPHVIDDECCMPKLCPGSCTRTTQPADALYQVSFCGRCGVPSS